MNIEFDYNTDNNINVSRKINKKFSLTKNLSKNFYTLVDELYRKYEHYNI